MMKYLVFFLLSTCAFASDISFLLHGQEKAALSLDEMKKKFKVTEEKIWEPHEDKEVTYLAFDFKEILNVVYGDSWKATEEILFTCTDGYQPSIPLNLFQKHKALLAFERKNSSFTLKDRFHNQDVRELSPFYLIWDNLKEPQIKEEGAGIWPWALAKVDLIEFAAKFPNLAPPKKANARVKHGFLLFRSKCLNCHSINGEGGAKGVELNYPHSVTEYFQPKFLRQWILDPSSLRANAAMPKFNTDASSWSSDLDDIIEYLKAMAKSRPKALK